MEKEFQWMIGPFVKSKAQNPCLMPKADTGFQCPLRKETVYWEAKDVFNPAAVVRNGRVYLLYRAEDAVGRYAGTSRIGIAASRDGARFETEAEPVLFPAQDGFEKLEWEGGCEDPRIVETEEGTYYLYYTAYDGKTAVLCCAESRDLHRFIKHGPVFGKALGGKYAKLWSKSGAVVCRQDGEHFYPVRLNGKYWMYWGESNIYAAVSDDLIDWEPVEFWADGADCPVLQPVVMPTCFLEGLVYFKGKYYLYYGTADSKIALAQSE